MELRMLEGQSSFPDMIFNNIKLKCYIVIELRVVDFIPEFAGKLNFYISAACQLPREEGDNPFVVLLIYRKKEETVVK